MKLYIMPKIKAKKQKTGVFRLNIFLLLIIGFLLFAVSPSQGQEISNLPRTIAETIHNIEAFYVEPVSRLELIENGFTGLEKKLRLVVRDSLPKSELAETIKIDIKENTDSFVYEISYSTNFYNLILSKNANIEEASIMLSESLVYLEPLLPGQYDINDLLHWWLQSITNGMDDNTQFLEAGLFKDYRRRLEGEEFGGIGIVLYSNELRVRQPIADTPADKAGLKSQDRIVAINGESTEKMSNGQAISKMKGTPGTEVILSILSENAEESRDVKIIRGNIPVPSVRHEMRSGKIGLMRITHFQDGTHLEVKHALEDLASKGAEKLILDLRFNGGGIFMESLEVAGFFLEPGQVIVTAKMPDMQNKSIYRVDRNGKQAIDWPVAVLMNAYTGSAAEVLAAALRDHGRCMLVGKKSSGSGALKNLMPMQDGSALKLTTHRLFSPDGYPLSPNGLEPDYRISNPDAQMKKAEEVLSY
jgi:carboxyl-terminal processing protease